MQRIRSDLIIREVEGEIVVFDAIRDTSFVLNQTAALVLELYRERQPPKTIERELRALFPETQHDIGADVEAVLHAFSLHGFFEPSSD